MSRRVTAVVSPSAPRPRCAWPAWSHGGNRRPSGTATAAAAAFALIALGASACSSSSSTTSTGGSGASGGSSSSSAAAKKYNLQLIVGTKDDNFYVTMECGAQAEAKRLGMNISVNGPADFTVSEQKPLIDDAMTTKPDALLVAPTDTSALDPDLQQVQSNGTKVVFVDTSSSNTSLGVSRITSDNAEGGKMAADSLGAAIGGKGTVAVVTVKRGTSTTDARVQGFDQEMAAKYPSIKLLPVHYDDQDSSTVAASDIGGDISAHPDLGGVFAANVITAEGAATAVKSAGKSGKIKVAAFDAEPAEITAVQAGTIQMLVAQNPTAEGQDGVDQAVNALEGKSVQANITSPLKVITKDNVTSSDVKPFIYVSSCS
jgi:ABC-type sugar transport system substrate-binding protein